MRSTTMRRITMRRIPMRKITMRRNYKMIKIIMFLRNKHQINYL
jgi:hypothetical protein